MASLNTLTGLIAPLYAKRDVISRELTGLLPAVDIDASSEGAALNQPIRVYQTPIVASSTAVTPGPTPPDTGGNTVGYTEMTISKVQAIPIQYTGDEAKSLGDKYTDIVVDRVMQAIRTLANEMEYDLWLTAYKNASRGYGAAGTNPFATSNSPVAQLRKILDDNGAPGANTPGGRSLVINTTAGAAYRSLANNVSVYAAGTDMTLRNGTIQTLMGFDIKESAQIGTHTFGTATGLQINGSSADIGDTTVAVDGSDSGTLLAGDYVEIATGDTNKYMLQDTTQTASGAAAGNIVIGDPGLRIAHADNDEITVGEGAASYTPNVAFSRDAIKLLARTPAFSKNDIVLDIIPMRDPISGIVFTVAHYGGYFQEHIEVSIAYGYKAIKPRHIAVLVG